MKAPFEDCVRYAFFSDKINVRSGDREHDIPHSVLSEEAEVSATDNSLTPDSQTSMESARQTLHYVISQNVKENFIDDSSVEYSSCYQQQRYSKDIQTLPKILTEHRTYSRAKSEIRRPGQSASIIGDLIVRRKQWCVICGFLGRILLCLFTKTALSKVSRTYP